MLLKSICSTDPQELVKGDFFADTSEEAAEDLEFMKLLIQAPATTSLLGEDLDL